MTLAGSPGYHWYGVPRVGHPDPDSFRAAYEQLAALHDELWERTGITPARTILGGFSMGTVMGYALGLGPERPAPSGIVAFSGFVPSVDGWHADLATRAGLPVLIAHGRRDQVIDVGFAQQARELLEAGGLKVSYHESEAGHHIDPRELPSAQAWVQETLPAGEIPHA
jgi:phospholipase/carboxylesterase